MDINNTSFRRSADLVNWSSTQTMPLPGIFDLNSYNGALVGLQNGFVSYSYDGMNWVPMNIGFSASDIAASPDVLFSCRQPGTAGLRRQRGRDITRCGYHRPG